MGRAVAATQQPKQLQSAERSCLETECTGSVLTNDTSHTGSAARRRRRVLAKYRSSSACTLLLPLTIYVATSTLSADGSDLLGKLCVKY